MEHSDSASATERREDFGKLQYGFIAPCFRCEHYKRRCKIRTPCCNQIFPCRHCHNDAMSSLSNPKDRHELVRHDIEKFICSICYTEQEVANVCSNCGVNMGEYYCEICKFYDDNTDKGQFQCVECEICRSESYIHGIFDYELDRTCYELQGLVVVITSFTGKCGSCYSVGLQNNHLCVENSMKSFCPVCYEYLFDSIKGTRFLNCGHTMHTECFQEMAIQNHYRCPLCSKSIFDMSQEHLDQEIEAVPMPEEYNFEVSILCNDYNTISPVSFHIFGHKCRHCSSYNTRRISTPELL